MKKTNLRVLALAAGILTMGGVFAQTPASNTNMVTSGLIEDDIVDQIDTGVEGKDFLFFGGYGLNTNQIQIGAGKFFGPNLWLSLYEGYYLKANTTNEESVTKDNVAGDGVNIDYTDSSSSASTSGSLNLKNDIALSLFLSNKIGGTLYWNTDSITYSGYDATDPTGELSPVKTGRTTTSDSSEIHAAGTQSDKIYTALENTNSKNTFGVSFNGLRTPYLFGDLKFYAGLSSLAFTMERRFINIAWSQNTTLNGSTVDGLKQPVYSGTYDYNTFTPSLSATLGLTLPKLWDCVTPDLSLGEGFSISFKNNASSYNYAENTTNNSTQLVRTTTDYSREQGKFIDWTNTLTPKITFDFDFSERLILKASVISPVSLSGKYTGADSFTERTTTKTTDISSGEITTTEVLKKGGERLNTDIFTTSVSPSLALGFAYKVVPEKFNINMGVSASCGALTWEKRTSTNSHIPEVSTTTFTDAYGNTTTTGANYTPTNGDGTLAGDAMPENERNTFSAGEPSAEARFGFTWFLGEKSQIDTYVLYGSSAGTSLPTWAMNVTFGLRF